MTASRCLTPLFACVLLIVCTSRADAQLAAYATIAGSQFDFYGQDNTLLTYTPLRAAINAGAFYNFPIQGRFKAGVDLRALYTPGNSGGIVSTAALRISFVPRQVRFRPYFQIGGGVVSTAETYGTVYVASNSAAIIYISNGYQNTRTTNGALVLNFGLDLRVNDSIDWRVLELSGVGGAASNSTTASAAYIDTGVIYHFKPRSKKP